MPVRFIHEPWTMSPDERSKFGAEGYPSPCLDPSRFRDDGGSRLKRKGRGRGR